MQQGESNPSSIQGFLSRLSPEQMNAVRLDRSAICMSACAGSGKTETLTARMIYLLNNDIKPENIVAFTFTDRAAQAMKTRLHKRIIEVGGLESRKMLAPLFVGTIHAFCLRILQDYAGFDNFDVLDEHKETAFAIEHGRELDLHQVAAEIVGRQIGYSAAVSIFLRSMSVVNNELMDRASLGRWSLKFAKMLQKYESIMTRHLVFNFGQLISLSVQALERDPTILEAIAGSIRHLLIDEYQDLNPAQEKLVHLLISKGASLFAVGDAKQCIYQWRGSDFRCFEKFHERFPDSVRVALNLNRRSQPGIVDVANKVGHTITKSADEHMTPHKERTGDSVWWVEESTPETEAKWIVAKVLELNKSGVRFSDIAILLRSVKTSGEPFIREFRQAKVPFVLGGRIGLFRRDEMQCLGRIFAWLSDMPWLEDPYTGALQTKYLVQTALLDNWRCKPEEYAILQSELEDLKTEVSGNRLHNLTEVFKRVIIILGFLDLDHKDPVDSSLMGIMGRFNQLLTDYESTIKRQDSSYSSDTTLRIKDLLKGFTWYVNSYASTAYEEEIAEDKREVDAVILTTVHQAKGLEWPVVFVPCLISRRFPSSRTGQRQDWLLHRGIFDTGRYESTLVDERRLFYVALTRAKDGLYLSWFRKGEKKAADPSPLLFAAMPENVDTSPTKSSICTVSRAPVDEPEVATYSPSEVLWYRRCPYSYLLRKVWGFQPGLVRELGYGKALHHIMRLVGHQMKHGRKINAEVVRQIVDQHFYLPYASFATASAMKDSAARKIARFVENNIDDIERIQEIEARLEFPVGSGLVYGIVDVILRHGGNSVEARDYKTTRADPHTDAEADFQIRLYSAGLRQMGYLVEAVSIANLQEEQIRIVDISEDVLSSIVNETQQHINGIKSGDYSPKFSRYCGDCDYRDICRYYRSTK